MILMKNNKGAANIWVVVLVVVVAIVGGYFAFQNSDFSDNEQIKNNTSVDNTWKNSDGSCSKIPQYEDFKVEVFKGQPKFTPTWPGMQENDYYIRDNDAVQKTINEQGVNFAGHYTMFSQSCGSGCTGFGAVDLITGHPYRIPNEFIIDWK